MDAMVCSTELAVMMLMGTCWPSFCPAWISFPNWVSMNVCTLLLFGAIVACIFIWERLSGGAIVVFENPALGNRDCYFATAWWVAPAAIIRPGAAAVAVKSYCPARVLSAAELSDIGVEIKLKRRLKN